VIEAWQFSLGGNSGTRSEKKSLFCGAQKRQNPQREIWANRIGSFPRRFVTIPFWASLCEGKIARIPPREVLVDHHRKISGRLDGIAAVWRLPMAKADEFWL
jgi:hypothetical protein